MSDIRTIHYSGPLKGRLRLPGDKSISHRGAMLLAVSHGTASIENFSDSEDCMATLNCLIQLGVSVKRQDSTVVIEGAGQNGLVSSPEPLECGNSGTTMRLLSGLIAGTGFDAVLRGDDSLSTRPMQRIAEPLRQMGADIETSDGRPPIVIRGHANLNAIEYELPVASAQVKSCILLAGLNAVGQVTVIGPASQRKVPVLRDHTERMLQYLGARITENYLNENGLYKHIVTLEPGNKLESRNISVPCDISTAAFFLVAAAGLKGSDITLDDVGLNSSRAGILDVMKDCGVRISVGDVLERCNEARGNLRVSRDSECRLTSSPVVISGERTAEMIDEIPILAILGTLLPGGLEVRDALELRIKETDRINAIVENLKLMGAEIEEFEDGFKVSECRLRGAKVDTFGDHRIAMAFAVAGLFADGETTIVGADCVSVSYPGFFDTLNRMTKNA